jgi:threonine dehydrogenase-like Zn-dependent dehydrogenase
MKAAVVHEFKAPLRLEDVAKPAPGPEQIVVKIEASGLCHTDIHAAHGDWPVKPKLPLIPGHDGIEPSDELAKELKQHVRTVIGPLATPDELEFVPSLPKTRSGKIMRRVVRARELGEPVGDVTTMDV